MIKNRTYRSIFCNQIYKITSFAFLLTLVFSCNGGSSAEKRICKKFSSDENKCIDALRKTNLSADTLEAIAECMENPSSCSEKAREAFRNLGAHLVAILEPSMICAAGEKRSRLQPTVDKNECTSSLQDSCNDRANIFHVYICVDDRNFCDEFFLESLTEKCRKAAKGAFSGFDPSQNQCLEAEKKGRLMQGISIEKCTSELEKNCPDLESIKGCIRDEKFCKGILRRLTPNCKATVSNLFSGADRAITLCEKAVKRKRLVDGKSVQDCSNKLNAQCAADLEKAGIETCIDDINFCTPFFTRDLAAACKTALKEVISGIRD